MLGAIVKSRLTWEIVAVVVAVGLVVAFVDDIGGWFGMRSKASFEQAVLAKDRAVAAKEEVGKAAEARAAEAEKAAAVAEQRAADKAAQLAQVNRQLDAIIKARPSATEVVNADTKQAATDAGVCALIERVLRVPCARVRMVKSCGG